MGISDDEVSIEGNIRFLLGRKNLIIKDIQIESSLIDNVLRE